MISFIVRAKGIPFMCGIYPTTDQAIARCEQMRQAGFVTWYDQIKIDAAGNVIGE